MFTACELFFRTLDDKNAEGNADNGGLACEVSEGSLTTLLRTTVFFLITSLFGQ